MTIRIEDYWPIIQPGHMITKLFNGITQYLVSDGKGGTIIKQFQANQWEPNKVGSWEYDWYYRYDPQRGVLEYKDDYPLSAGHLYPAVMMPGEEIVWGGGTKYPVLPGAKMMVPCTIAGPLGGEIGAQQGLQKIAFHGLADCLTPAGEFKDCLQLTYTQPWGKHGSEDGGILWLAKDIGMVSAHWIHGGNLTNYTSTLQRMVVSEP